MRRQFVVSGDAAAEARRRVLRELHDGVGPSLAAIALGLRAARELLPRDAAAAGRLLVALEEEAHGAVAEVRRLAADAQHPPVLARLGLVGAVRAHAGALAGRHPVAVEVEVVGELPELGADVEVAAYRIVCEALTNVVRHAGARRCAVWLRFTDRLRVEVVDDGVGLPREGGLAGEGGPAGVGLRSMRERAREVGGTWAAEVPERGGTRIAVELPAGG
ncbi:sensor histidine kinase [Actinosynnema sp.]|uniref:sensor histidine kinase n=1 Tax=Actinosynnema sp. TaxID=1872144 RepID=UPI003F848F6B